MSKAEDLSKQYRDFREQCGIKDHVMLDEIEEACFEGYHQAEKYLELTWEDIRCIYLFVISVSDMQGWKGTDKSIYQEVLKRFKERKEK